MFLLSPETQLALQTLNDAGFEAYLVGGCVRDYLLGVTPTDIDITTSAKPDEIKAAFCNYMTIDTGIRHGTVTVLINHQAFEITTYRVDVGYSDGRHPDEVRFTASLYEDAARRDFTVNAMAYHPDAGVIDFFNGRDDLATGVIRCVGDPVRRFGEDALRMLRALRFAATLGFSIDPATSAALRRQKHLLSQVSAERVTAELCKLLIGKNAGEVLRQQLTVLAAYLPELEHLDPDMTGSLLRRLPQVLHLRLSGLLIRLSLPKGLAVLERLRLTNKVKQSSSALLTLYHKRYSIDKHSLRFQLFQFGVATVLDCYTLMAEVRAIADDSLGANDARRAIMQVQAILDNNECYNKETLALRGADLAEFGLVGAEINDMLMHLVYEVLDGRLENTREALLAYLRKRHHK